MGTNAGPQFFSVTTTDKTTNPTYVQKTLGVAEPGHKYAALQMSKTLSRPRSDISDPMSPKTGQLALPGTDYSQEGPWVVGQLHSHQDMTHHVSSLVGQAIVHARGKLEASSSLSPHSARLVGHFHDRGMVKDAPVATNSHSKETAGAYAAQHSAPYIMHAPDGLPYKGSLESTGLDLDPKGTQTIEEVSPHDAQVGSSTMRSLLRRGRGSKGPQFEQTPLF